MSFQPEGWPLPTEAAMNFKHAVVFALAAGIAGLMPAKAAQFEMKLSEVHEANFPTTLADMEFARLVNVGTQGRVHITVYAGGTINQDEKAVIEQTQMGALDFARVSLSPISQFAKELNVLTLPYLYRDSDHMWKVLSGPIGKQLLGAVSKANLVGLCYYDAGARSFYNTKKDIKSVADLKGMKIRVQQAKLPMDMVKLLGASPTPMATGDIYSAMQTNVIDGAENNWPSYISFSHYEVAKYFTVDRHMMVPEILVAGKLAMAKLSKADQEVVMKAAEQSVPFQKKLWVQSEKDNEAIAKAKGCHITYLDAKAMAEFEQAVQPIYAEYSEFSDLINQIKAVK
jgi:tripartite ATP-independent transporter DctP family solute receptor